MILQGFVETITGRRRYLPDINLPGHNSCGKYGGNEYARAAAERQAVNTTIQGSAADIIKKAMINIDRCLTIKFPTNKGAISKSTKSIDCGAFLVLQLHDELIYEVFFIRNKWNKYERNQLIKQIFHQITILILYISNRWPQMMLLKWQKLYVQKWKML